MVVTRPPMGWNSWNTFGDKIDEKLIMETADAMVRENLAGKACFQYARQYISYARYKSRYCFFFSVFLYCQIKQFV